MAAKIDNFMGPHRFLSNFFPSPVVLDGVTYPSVEHAFQAAKTTGDRSGFLHGPPGDAKRLGRRVVLRAGWDEMRLSVMEDLVRQKFAREPLRSRLLATGDAVLIEGNTWGDRFWGVCGGVGENHLGRLLMKVRARLGPCDGDGVVTYAFDQDAFEGVEAQCYGCQNCAPKSQAPRAT